jgi:hypothetical protein
MNECDIEKSFKYNSFLYYVAIYFKNIFKIENIVGQKLLFKNEK